jgi:hypothetical protein
MHGFASTTKAAGPAKGRFSARGRGMPMRAKMNRRKRCRAAGKRALPQARAALMTAGSGQRQRQT